MLLFKSDIYVRQTGFGVLFHAECYYMLSGIAYLVPLHPECQYMLSVIMLCVIMPSVIMLSVIILGCNNAECNCA